MHKKAKFLLTIFQVKFKIILFIFAFFYVIGLFAYTLRGFRSDDPIPEVKVITATMRKHFRELATIVRTGLYIKNFSTFEITNNNFVVDALVWFEFNKNEIMLKTIDKFSFDNAKITYKSPAHVTIIDDKILVKYDITFETKTNLNFYRFPLEDHRLSMVLTNNFISSEEMYFDDIDNGLSFVISDNLFISNWKVHRLFKNSGFSSLHFDQHNLKHKLDIPKVVFAVDLKKSGINKILIIFVPLFAAIFLSLFTFLMSFNSYQGKTNLSISAVTALLGYRFVIQQISPPVGYFTITDKIFIFFLILTFFIFAFQVVLLRHYMFLMEREKIKRAEQPEADIEFLTPRVTERINSLVYFLCIALFLVVVTHIILV